MLLTVIVNYRTPQLTIDCLHSLVGELEAVNGHAVVTDNASGDDSVARLQAAVAENGWGDRVKIVPLAKNGGYAYGNNAAIRSGLDGDHPPDYVWLLNPDTIVRPGAARQLIEFMEQHPEAGIVGSRQEGPAGEPLYYAFRFFSPLSELNGAIRSGIVNRLLARRSLTMPIADEAHRADWVCGASMLVRRRVFADVGLLDEDYFMYFEEVDFCRRAANAGWQCWCEPASRIIHLEGQSSGVTDRRAVPKRRPAYWFESRRRYFLTHHNGLYVLLVDLAWMAGYSVWWLKERLLGRPHADPPRMWRDFFGHSVLVRGFRL